MSEEDGGGSMCRQRRSRGRLKWSQGGRPAQARSPCPGSGREGTPVVHRGSRGQSGSDSAGNKVVKVGQKVRRTMWNG